MGSGQLDQSSSRAAVLRALDAGGIELTNAEEPGRYILIAKVDDDAFSDRRATYHHSETAARAAIRAVPQGWWPDCLIDLDAPAQLAVREAAVGDGSLSDPYPFDGDHVIFA